MGRDNKKKDTKVGKKGKGSSAESDLNEKLRPGEHLDDIDPAVVRFTHSKISPTFSCGRRLEDTLTELVEGRLKVSQLPKITVLYGPDGSMYSMNNRRLWTLKQLRDKGMISGNKITARLRPLSSVKTKCAEDRYNSERCSLSAKLMHVSKPTEATDMPATNEEVEDSADLGTKKITANHGEEKL
eukprot:CFRG3221T1